MAGAASEGCNQWWRWETWGAGRHQGSHRHLHCPPRRRRVGNDGACAVRRERAYRTRAPLIKVVALSAVMYAHRWLSESVERCVERSGRLLALRVLRLFEVGSRVWSRASLPLPAAEGNSGRFALGVVTVESEERERELASSSPPAPVPTTVDSSVMVEARSELIPRRLALYAWWQCRFEQT